MISSDLFTLLNENHCGINVHIGNTTVKIHGLLRRTHDLVDSLNDDCNCNWDESDD